MQGQARKGFGQDASSDAAQVISVHFQEWLSAGKPQAARFLDFVRIINFPCRSDGSTAGQTGVRKVRMPQCPYRSNTGGFLD